MKRLTQFHVKGLMVQNKGGLSFDGRRPDGPFFFPGFSIQSTKNSTMRPILIAYLIFLKMAIFGQVSIKICPIFGEKPLEIDQNQQFPLKNGDTATVTTLKFYLSNIALFQAGQRVFLEENSFHLIDATDGNTLFFTLKNAPADFDELRFDLGIDSLTSVSGVFGGDLDPTRGMFWTWQSGYIDFKVEGSSRFCPTRKHEFEFHLGGLGRFDCLQKLALKTGQGRAGELKIGFDARLFFEKIDLRTVHSVMSPGEDAVKLSAAAAGCFRVLGE